MKILVLSNNDGGLYGFRKELLLELMADGNEVYVSVPAGPYVPRLRGMGCHCMETSLDRRGVNPAKDLRLLWDYCCMARKIAPDIVLTYTIKPNIYGGLICRFLRIKYIANITGLGTAIEKKGLLSKALLCLYKIALKDVSQVFFQNRDNQDFFREKRITNKGRLIPGSGVNLLEHCYEEYPEDDGKIRFLFIGRIMRDKGIGELLDCAEWAGERKLPVVFHLVGTYDEDAYRGRIKKLEEKGVVKHLGYQDDVHSFIKTHHAVILPSYHEGLSNVLLESAASGRPILATDVPGCRETYIDMVSGIGFREKDSKALIKAVETFLRLPYEEKAEMGRRGRRKMEQEFGREIVIKAYIQEIIRAARKGKE